ncbi:MAG: hypothetical protein KDB03_15370 [Planctomycetales bacterium]|nr:hypothetical protein [Planctomycetales bacterium]
MSHHTLQRSTPYGLAYYTVCASISMLLLAKLLIVPLFLCLLISPFPFDHFVQSANNTAIWMSNFLLLIGILLGFANRKVFAFDFLLTIAAFTMLPSCLAGILVFLTC